MSEETKATEVVPVQYRDLRTTEICTLVNKDVELADGKKVQVPYAVYARGHERALEKGEEKNFEEIKVEETKAEEPVAPLAEA